MSGTLTYTITYSTLTCCHAGCAVSFALTDSFIRHRREDHGWFYCPNGHRQHYSAKNDEEILRQALDNTENQLAAARRIATTERERREHAERQRAAARGQVTKIKNRVGKGVCPCCNRHFANLQRHIEGQHPDFIEPTS